MAGGIRSHGLARVKFSLEPDLTGRVLEIPELNELRNAQHRAPADRPSGGDRAADIDPGPEVTAASPLMLAVLMSVTRLGSGRHGVLPLRRRLGSRPSDLPG